MGFTRAAVCFTLLTVALSYPSGAPDTGTILQGMIPGHGGPQLLASSCPFKVTSTRKGDEFTLILQPKSGKASYKGFLVEVRNARGVPIGIFSSGANYHTIGGRTAATHSDSRAKTSTTFKWNKPADVSQAFVHFTVVESFKTYWSNVKTQILP